ncbi:CtsR family transcriptional regulator [Vagococcus salmoninarum]|uniref:Transcriptional regulator CtsR n=1 Tax=Vagococcus salmoninarum TaxID=2739 RepID=A0A429ZCA1_9ENTE|nr:CtsR family transcriptional regulator [Vagococcus salmoninarum]MBE9390212.1 CtsR family transcriptional regulator [Vagococcus salmoninarum]RST91321.1 CtsR family transcriptional regulator [Vagococcus salmoninarum]
MDNQNISDLIEEYLKEILLEQERIEIRRGEMANQFSCVPSQINYVINTRFTVAQGYSVESKRGGGGYIRIQKVNLNNHGELISALSEVVGTSLSQKDGVAILQQLYDYDIISQREASLIVDLLSNDVLQNELNCEKETRARMLKRLLERLRYEEKE